MILNVELELIYRSLWSASGVFVTISSLNAVEVTSDMIRCFIVRIPDSVDRGRRSFSPSIEPITILGPILLRWEPLFVMTIIVGERSVPFLVVDLTDHDGGRLNYIGFRDSSKLCVSIQTCFVRA